MEIIQMAKPVKAGKLYFAVKRGIDLAMATLALLMLSVPLAFIALAVKLDSRGSVFYLQQRAGKKGKPFDMVKFRSMIPNAEHSGLGYEVAEQDPRITRVGRWLRVWGVDELPQLYNVIKGDMSLIGPRAARLDQIGQFTAVERLRMLIRPGLTGWAQVNGRNSISWKRRIELDLWYLAHQSLWLDLIILIRTVWTVFITRSGRYGPEGVTRDYGD